MYIEEELARIREEIVRWHIKKI